MIRALIFDFDGLILETEVPCYEAWQEIYREYGVHLPLPLWQATIGRVGGFDPISYLEKQLGKRLEREELRARHKARHLELTAARSVYPGVLEIIEAAEKAGLLLGVASSSSRGWVTGHLGRLGLLPRFHALKCRDDVGKVKPDPELYRAVMRDLGVEGAETIAFEDSPPGIIAAKEAGLFCVAVPSELTKGLDFGRADLCLDSLAGVELEWLLARAGGEAA
ncbi:MAG: HAD family hydrolase [Firmicutes bacterium]|nr:HAD family hydrolase [Bacillota bacterium]